MKTIGLNGCVFYFSVDYAIAVDDILDIHKYVMEKIWYNMLQFV